MWGTSLPTSHVACELANGLSLTFGLFDMVLGCWYHEVTGRFCGLGAHIGIAQWHPSASLWFDEFYSLEIDSLQQH